MFMSPIQGISAYGNTSMIQPMNYAVENDSNFSSVYNTQSTKGTGGINAASPVQYPNAKVVETNPLEKKEQVLQTDKEFNGVASKFNGAIIGYDGARNGYGYSISGSQFDAYA